MNLSTATIMVMSITPENVLDSFSGRHCDFQGAAGDGFAIGFVKLPYLEDQVEVTFEESDDNSVWAPIQSGGMNLKWTFSSVFDGVLIAQYPTTKRYGRAVLNTSAANDLYLAVTMGRFIEPTEQYTTADRNALLSLLTVKPDHKLIVDDQGRTTATVDAISDHAFGWDAADTPGIPATVIGKLRRWINEWFLPKSRNRTTNREESFAADGVTVLHARSISTTTVDGQTTDTVSVE
ncbi:MAG: hypothetical protein U0798_15055 [Gemmataceae bacterium]